ncbi:hypothetical protein UFOVP157_48 [uncultured Caudovirales phage]|uniref:Uncharacterized protein n=1 Tax=uncultured Caudovirales phage TaxID=2100421 RepID=A0A6J7WCP3_9CAUD|nr:hypothetical protein UFOVP157_48 [uncultured Caudovirales phage]
MIAFKKKRRAWGSVKRIVSVCQEAGMTCDEIHFGTGINKRVIWVTARQLKVKLRSPHKPLLKYYVQQ